ncbi:alpha/beta hydrolase [Allomuricauda sp. SCSIO 65647]|uniref:alpha/beta hydrolase n=1 Tax=Allomuricauda sp. SCSIO 65647 TaxID=2908843 RepID=UPI001F42ECBD|nr:alpha/beta fold hydrolase [Muricauda sp. SCSIO 65647]UJH67172.1 alpha/beta fold hydrolase [Muricauda sp. SCSIO 65647]
MSPASLSLTHLVRPAKNVEKAPVLFMLHGYGSNEEDLFSFANELPEELFIISIRAPYNLEFFGYAWYAINFDAKYGKWSDDGQAIESREKVVNFINEACEAYPVDPNDITLLGFSQGTVLSFSIALSYPEKIKNVIALSGYINEAILKEGYGEKDFSDLQIYTSHGQVDQVIPLEWAQRSPEFLDNLGIAYMYEEFPVGHGVSPQNFYSFKKWLVEQL